MLQGRGKLQSCQVYTAVKSEMKVSRDIRRKEALLWVVSSPRRELQSLSKALWDQQKERFSLIIRMSLIPPSSAATGHPTQERQRMSEANTQPRHPIKGIGGSRPREKTQVCSHCSGWMGLRSRVFRVTTQSPCSATAVVLRDKHKAYGKWDYMMGLFLKALAFREN